MISIVIPNWNGRSILEKNLPSVIEAFENKRNQIKEIIVVDDGSSDDSVNFLRKIFSQTIKIIVHKKNRGFSSAVNTGVRTATGQLICLLNTDVHVSKDFLVSTISLFEDEKVFAVSLHEDGFGPAKGKFTDGFIVHQGLKSGNKVSDSFWASGGSAIFRRSIWMELGGMDEKLLSPFYWEDLDLSYRAQKRGYKVLWDPSADVEHRHESIINTDSFKKNYLNLVKERNQLLICWKNLTSPNLFKKHRSGLIKRIFKHPGYIKVFFAALMKLNLVLKLRAKEKRESIISDEAVFAKFS